MGKVKKLAKNLVVGLIILITSVPLCVPVCFYACYKTYNESKETKKKEDEKRKNERKLILYNRPFVLGTEGGYPIPKFQTFEEIRASRRRDQEKWLWKQKEEENRKKEEENRKKEEENRQKEERTLQQKSALVKKLEILERDGAQIDNLYGMELTLEELEDEYETIIAKRMFEERIRQDERRKFKEAHGKVQEEKIREGVKREFKKRRFNRGQCENRI